jgi:hypothetical protein
MYDPTLGVAYFVLLMRTVTFHNIKMMLLKATRTSQPVLGKLIESYVVVKIQLSR